MSLSGVFSILLNGICNHVLLFSQSSGKKTGEENRGNFSSPNDALVLSTISLARRATEGVVEFIEIRCWTDHSELSQRMNVGEETESSVLIGHLDAPDMREVDEK